MINKCFLALGNDRPQTLVQLEDCVLKAIMSISLGKSREEVMGHLYSQILSLEKELAFDDVALNWFNFPNPKNLKKADFEVPSTPPPSEFAPLSEFRSAFDTNKDTVQGQCSILSWGSI